MQYEIKISAKNKQADTQYLCSVISAYLNNNDAILLWGDLGAGKTYFTSELINHLNNKYTALKSRCDVTNIDETSDKITVQSPTFNLTYEYELKHYNIQHYDFYRLNDYDEIIELGYEEILDEKLVIIEWPERLEDNLPFNRLDVKISYDESNEGRIFILIAHGNWAKRLRRLINLESFLLSCNFNQAIRKAIYQDASLRRYERIYKENKSYILMDFPSLESDFYHNQGNDNIISFNKNSYRAYNVQPYIYYTDYLHKIGLNVPQIYHADDNEGFLIIEDFGNYNYAELTINSPQHQEAYEVAIDNLIYLQNCYASKPSELLLNESDYKPSLFADDAILLIDYFYRELYQGAGYKNTKADIWELWYNLFSDEGLNKSISLRDYHSPNLFWLPNNKGLQKTGIIDFQDAFIAPTAYDLVSLIQDGRIYYNADFENNLLAYFFKQISATDDYKNNFLYEYQLCACQRSSKNLGLFIRLAKRDNKLKYLKYLSINLAYLKRSLTHPLIENIKSSYEKLGLLDDNNIEIILSKFDNE